MKKTEGICNKICQMVFFILRLSLKVTEETLIEHRLLSLTEAGDV